MMMLSDDQMQPHKEAARDDKEETGKTDSNAQRKDEKQRSHQWMSGDKEETKKKARRQNAHSFRQAQQRQTHHSAESSAYREASTNFHFYQAHIGGGFVNNHMHSDDGQFGENQTGRMFNRVSEREIDLIWRVYQPPQAYQHAYSQLRQQRVLILQGRNRIGKRAAAIKLSLDVHEQDELEIHDLPGDISLMRRLREGTLEEGSAYIADAMLGNRISQLKVREWRALVERMESADCTLVVCVDSSIKLPNDLPHGMCCVIDRPMGNLRDLIVSHIHYYARQLFNVKIDEEAIDACLVDARISSILADDRLMPVEAAQLSSALVSYLTDKCDLEQALQKFSVYAENQVVDWFEATEVASDYDEIRERALRITLAIFDGLPQRLFHSLEKELRKRLLQHFGIKTPREERDQQQKRKKDSDALPTKSLLPFGAAANARSPLKRAQASLVSTTRRTDYYEKTLVRVVKLDTPQFKRALLQYLLEDDRYVELLDVVIGWLRDLGGARNVDIRARAAVAVATLAQHDFARMRAEILEPWIDQDHKLYRSTLSMTFGEVMWNDELVGDTLSLITHWTRSKDQKYYWAAMRVYTRVGLRFPARALYEWRVIFEKMQREVEIPVNNRLSLVIKTPIYLSFFDALQGLYIQALEYTSLTKRIYAELLLGLRDWVRRDARPDAKTQVGLLAFFYFVSMRMLPEENEQSLEEVAPAVLYLIHPNEAASEYVINLTWLFRKALQDKAARADSLNILHQWVKYAQHDRAILPKLMVLMRTLTTIGTKRETDRIRLQLYRWATRSRKPLPVAGTILKRLRAEQQKAISQIRKGK